MTQRVIVKLIDGRDCLSCRFARAVRHPDTGEMILGCRRWDCDNWSTDGTIEQVIAMRGKVEASLTMLSSHEPQED